MGMNTKESKKLNSLINLAIEWNDGEDNYKIPYGCLANELRECELHITQLTGWPRKSPYNSIISYTFKVEDRDIQSSLQMRENYLVKMCEELLEDDCELPYDEDGEPTVEIKLVRKVSKLPVAPQITFEKCADIVISNIENANHSILAAVAWFTNPAIMQALIKKSEEGLAIAVIVDAGDENDTRNKQFIAKYPNLKFPIFYAHNMISFFKNYMHHKFCIIDNEFVLHGTFNWTIKAEYNDEDITKDPNPTNVLAFLDRFKELRKKYNCFYCYPN